MKRFVFLLSFSVVAWGLYQIATMWRYELHQSYLSTDQSTLLVVSRLDQRDLGRRYRLDIIDLQESRRVRTIFQQDLGWPPMEFAISATGRYVAIATESKLRVIDTRAGVWKSEQPFQLPLSNYYGYIAFTEDERSVYFHYHYENKVPSEAIGIVDLASGKFHTVWFPKRVHAVRRELAKAPIFCALVSETGGQAYEFFEFKDGQLRQVIPSDAEIAFNLRNNRSLPKVYVAVDQGIVRIDPTTLIVTGRLNKFTFVESPYRWWQTIAIAVTTAATIWWLVWCYWSRRHHRSRWPLLNIAVLYLLAIGTCLIRITTGPPGLPTSSLEFSVLLGIGASAMTLLGLVVVHGPQRFAMRITIGVLGISTVLATMLFVERQYQIWMPGWAVAAAALLVTYTVIAACAHRIGERLWQVSDAESKRPARQRFKILDLMTWTLATAIALLLFTLMDCQELSIQHVTLMLAIGSAMGVMARTMDFISLSSVRARFRWPLGALLAPLPLAAIALCFGDGQLIKQWRGFDGLLYGDMFGSCGGLVLLAGLALRFNGYRLSRPAPGKPAASVIPSRSAKSPGLPDSDR